MTSMKAARPATIGAAAIEISYGASYDEPSRRPPFRAGYRLSGLVA